MKNKALLKKVIGLFLTAVITASLFIGSTLNVAAMNNYNRWNYGQDRQINQLLTSKQEINDEGKTQQYIEYTYDDAGRILSAYHYEDTEKTALIGFEKYTYEDGFKKVTIEDYNSDKILCHKNIYEYVAPFDVLKNYDEQPFAKLTGYDYDSTTGKEMSRSIVTFSSDFKESKEEYANMTEDDEWYIYGEYTEKYDKSYFEPDAYRIYNLNIGYYEDGSIEYGSESAFEYNSHNDITSKTFRDYDTQLEKFVDDTYDTYEYKYDGDKMTEKVYTSRRADAPITSANKTKTTYSYNGNTCEELVYVYRSESYEESEKIIRTYDENGFTTKLEKYYWVSSDWVLNYTYEYEYDNKGRETVVKYLSYSSGEIVGGYSDKHEYDEFGNETLYSYSEWSTDTNEFVLSWYIKNVYTYTELKVEIPNDGDNSNMTGYIVLTFLSSVALTSCLVLGKKRKTVQ